LNPFNLPGNSQLPLAARLILQPNRPVIDTFLDQTIAYDQALFPTVLFDRFDTPTSAAAIPLAVDAVLNDVQDEDRLAGVLGAESNKMSQLSWPTHFAVVCTEDPVSIYEETRSLERLTTQWSRNS
jgi:hypothetical protein